MWSVISGKFPQGKNNATYTCRVHYVVSGHESESTIVYFYRLSYEVTGLFLLAWVAAIKGQST